MGLGRVVAKLLDEIARSLLLRELAVNSQSLGRLAHFFEAPTLPELGPQSGTLSAIADDDAIEFLHGPFERSLMLVGLGIVGEPHFVAANAEHDLRAHVA